MTPLQKRGGFLNGNYKSWLANYRRAWTTASGETLVKHACLISGIYVLLAIYLDPNRAYMFSEYSAKFVPFLRDAPVSGWFDTWAMGDPRPRIVNVAATVMNLRFREFYSHFFVLPPALGLSWLVYPITLVVLYRSLMRAGLSVLVSLSAALLWALSPSAIDSLCICYVPAKSLMPLAFALLLYLLVDLARQSEVHAPPPVSGVRQSVAIAAIAFLALMTDETSAIVFVVLAIVFLPTFFSKNHRCRVALIAWGGFVSAVVSFLFVAEIGYPWINRHFGQIPLDFLRTSILGPTAQYQSTTAAAVVSSHFSGFVKNFSPLGMAFTMLSAHLLPFRYVPGFWTWSSVRSFGVWPPAEAAFVFSFCGIFAGMAFTLDRRWLGLSLRLMVAVAALIILYAALLLPIAPSILEINYYGGLFSFPFAIAVALIACGSRKGSGQQLVPALLICCLAIAEILSYEQTSLRNRRQYSNFENFWNQQAENTWDYGELSRISREVEEGGFGVEVKHHPYPSRVFEYAFELEANREHKLGQKVDFYPIPSKRLLYAIMLQQHNEWDERNGVELRKPVFPTLAELHSKGGSAVGESAARSLMRNTTWRGYGRDWGFEQRFDESNGFVEQYWLFALMRLWQVTGRIQYNGSGRVELIEANHNHLPFSLIQFRQIFYAIGPDGSCLFQFTSEPNAPLTPRL